jgi:hypothetical protein
MISPDKLFKPIEHKYNDVWKHLIDSKDYVLSTIFMLGYYHGQHNIDVTHINNTSGQLYNQYITNKFIDKIRYVTDSSSIKIDNKQYNELLNDMIYNNIRALNSKSNIHLYKLIESKLSIDDMRMITHNISNVKQRAIQKLHDMPYTQLIIKLLSENKHMYKYNISQYPRKHIYSDKDVIYISLDLKKANWNTFMYYLPRLFNIRWSKPISWEEFIESIIPEDINPLIKSMIMSSRQIRQYIMGYDTKLASTGDISTHFFANLQKAYGYLMTTIHKLFTYKLQFLSCDEIVYVVDTKIDVINTRKHIMNVLNLNKDQLLFDSNLITITMYKLLNLNNKGYARLIYDDDGIIQKDLCDFKCVQPDNRNECYDIFIIYFNKS